MAVNPSANRSEILTSCTITIDVQRRSEDIQTIFLYPTTVGAHTPTWVKIFVHRGRRTINGTVSWSDSGGIFVAKLNGRHGAAEMFVGDELRAVVVATELTDFTNKILVQSGRL
jgi:hypothetical protein